MNTTGWEYYGRRGIDGEVCELYRMPVAPEPASQRLATKQRLRKGLFWLEAGDDNALANDWASGWFDFDSDRLTEIQVLRLIDDWALRDTWPGRP
jgi:hypothetical protein